jgi:hypothetical protein
MVLKINQYNINLFGNSDPIIYPDQIICRNFTCFEGGFIHIVSWLYMQYFDNKKSNENIKFLRKKLNDYSLDTSMTHFDDVKNIRTFLHHDVSSDNKQNYKVKLFVKKWFNECCNKEIPETEEDWHFSLEKILDDALIVFSSLHDCIEKISKDEFKEMIVSEWNKYIFPFSLYDIEQIVEKNAKRLEIPNLNAHKYTQKYYPYWKKELQMYSEIDAVFLDQFIEKFLRSNLF